jgi:hypothetical protein
LAKAKPELKGNDHESILKRARKRRRDGSAAWSDQNTRFDICMRMADGDQWEESMINARGESRPRVVVNLLEQHIQQVVNQNRQNRPGGKVSPVDNQADPDIAEIIEGLIRHIEYASNADRAYDTAIQYCITGALGYWGLDLDFAGPDTLDQELKVVRCADPKLWMIDPASIEPDGADARWFMELKRFSREEFEDQFPNSEAAMTDFSPPTDYADWIDNDGVWLCNYWEVKTKKRKLARVSANGQSQDVFLDELDKEDQAAVEAEADAVRDVDYPHVCCYLINGLEVLDETVWPGTRIPRYPAYGNERYVQGQRRLKSLISDSLEPQRMLNYHESLNVEAIALAPTPKWLMPEGADEGHETDWSNPNKARNKVLHWRQTSWGEAVPPVWQVFEPKSQAMDIGAARAQEYIKSTTGQFDPSLGNVDPGARSGKAIQALQAQGANATSHFAASLIPGLTRMYRDIIEVLGQVYKPGQVVQIIGADQAQKVMQVGQTLGQNTHGGKSLDFTTGRYDVTVSVGPSQQSQREEANEFAETLLQSPAGQNPQVAPKLTALITKLKQLGPIGDQIQELLDPKPKQNDPAQVQQQMQQMQQINEQLTQELHRVSQVIETKQIEQQGQVKLEDAKFEHALVLKKIDQETQLLINEAKLNAQVALDNSQRQLAYLQQQLKQAHDVGMASMSHAQAREQQDVAHQQGLEQQEQAAELAPEPAGAAQ